MGDVINITFSNKGLNFAAAWKNSNICRVFDLRKMDSAFEIPHSSHVNSVNFDNFGGYLATASSKELRFYTGKKWDEEIFTSEVHEGDINVVKFAPSGRYVCSGGEDRFMKVTGLR
jgi:WD40 repeat protein